MKSIKMLIRVLCVWMIVLLAASCTMVQQMESADRVHNANQLVLGMGTEAALGMLREKGYDLQWDSGLGGYASKPISGLAFILFESGGIIDEVVIAVVEPVLIKWEEPTDDFIEACNLPSAASGGVGAFYWDHHEELSIAVGGDGKAIVYPVPGIKFIYQMGFENMTSITLLSYSQTD